MIIKVTPAELKKQADQVKDDINEIERLWEAISDKVEGSKNYWEGDASREHMRIYEDIQDDVEKSIKKLKENPKKLMTMAGIYEEAETNAEAGAEQLPTDLF